MKHYSFLSPWRRYKYSTANKGYLHGGEVRVRMSEAGEHASHGKEEWCSFRGGVREVR